jgi:hypothetical protein
MFLKQLINAFFYVLTGATLLSGDVIQKVAFGIVDMDFYR